MKGAKIFTLKGGLFGYILKVRVHGVMIQYITMNKHLPEHEKNAVDYCG